MAGSVSRRAHPSLNERRIILTNGSPLKGATINRDIRWRNSQYIEYPRGEKSSKFQAPNSKLCGVWKLEFGASLELGAWNLELFAGFTYSRPLFSTTAFFSPGVFNVLRIPPSYVPINCGRSEERRV